jgi:predicted nucleic acid-binding protein
VIYFDAAYIAKCYLNEPGAERVRAEAHAATGLASCGLARLEFACILHRHVREGNITRREAQVVRHEFARDEVDGVWHWLPVTSALVERACERVARLPSTVFLRSGDAIHLECAREHGLGVVYTNDRHMLAAARHFGISCVDLLDAT